MNAKELLIDDRREGHGLEGKHRRIVHRLRVLFLAYNII